MACINNAGVTALQVAVVLLQCVMLVAGQGTWQVIQKNAGIAFMHAAITHFDTTILLDRTNIGSSAIKLPGGRCRNQPLERISKKVILIVGNAAERKNN